jgi:hypothetical protein
MWEKLTFCILIPDLSNFEGFSICSSLQSLNYAKVGEASTPYSPILARNFGDNKTISFTLIHLVGGGADWTRRRWSAQAQAEDRWAQQPVCKIEHQHKNDDFSVMKFPLGIT